MTQATSDRDYAEQREADTALDRARGHVQELKRLWETGGRFGDALPYFDQLEADLNTVRPQHVGAFVAQDGTPLFGDGTRPTGPQAQQYQSRIEPGSQASRPAAVGEGTQYPTDQQPITERDEEVAQVRQQRIEDGETEQQKADRMAAEDGADVGGDSSSSSSSSKGSSGSKSTKASTK